MQQTSNQTPDLTELEGRELTSVEFAADSITLRFDGPAITFFAIPDVFREEGSYAFGEPEFRNHLCALISDEVTVATIAPDHAIEIEFTSGVILRTSLREEDLELPLAGHFAPTGREADELIEF